MKVSKEDHQECEKFPVEIGEVGRTTRPGGPLQACPISAYSLSWLSCCAVGPVEVSCVVPRLLASESGVFLDQPSYLFVPTSSYSTVYLTMSRESASGAPAGPSVEVEGNTWTSQPARLLHDDTIEVSGSILVLKGVKSNEAIVEGITFKGEIALSLQARRVDQLQNNADDQRRQSGAVQPVIHPFLHAGGTVVVSGHVGQLQFRNAVFENCTLKVLHKAQVLLKECRFEWC